MAHEKFLDLSYGENPHQKAALYVEVGARIARALAGWRSCTAGRSRSTTCSTSTRARRLLDEFEEPACVIVKHNNPCGVAIAETVGEAYEKALACDPLSAFGGVIALNRPVDRALAERLHENFIEVLIAPGVRGRRARGAAAEGGDPDPRGRRAARLRAGERDVKRVRGGAAGPGPRPAIASRASRWRS